MITTVAVTTAFGHENREEGEYQLVVGFITEPAYEGEKNAVSLRVSKLATEDDQEHGHASGSHSDAPQSVTSGLMQDFGDQGHDEAEAVPVEGLESAVQVEVTHVPSDVSRTMDLRSVWGEPGHYAADLIPTSPGHYRFRFFGSIEGDPIDAIFDSRSGGGEFDDVRAASGIHFPQAVSSSRELESAIRGAQSAAQQAQDTAMTVDQRVGGASALAMVGIVLGAIGTALGGGSMLMYMRSRSS